MNLFLQILLESKIREVVSFIYLFIYLLLLFIYLFIIYLLFIYLLLIIYLFIIYLFIILSYVHRKSSIKLFFPVSEV